MFKSLKKALAFMSPRQKIIFNLLLVLRALVGLFDLAAILAIGLISSSTAVLLTQGNKAENTVELGPFSISVLGVETIPQVGALVLALFIVKASVSILLTHKLAHFLAKVEADASRQITESVFSYGLDGVRSHSRNDIQFAIQTGSPTIFNTLLNSAATLFSEGFLFVLVISAFAALSPLVALSAIIYFGAIALVIQFLIGRRLQKASTKVAEYNILSSGNLLDLGEVLREATIAKRTGFFIDNIYDARLKSANNIATQLVLQGTPRHVIETALIFGISLFLFIQSLSGDIAAAAAVTGVFLAGGLRLTAALLPLQTAFLLLKQSVPIANRAFKFLDLPIPPKSVLTASPAPEGPQSRVAISLKAVSYRYKSSENYALRDINLEIEAGSQTAFIGASGSGKSTLADLILGLAKPTSGAILIDGLSPDEWSKSDGPPFGYVPQNPGMISGTIAENITLGLDKSEIDQTRLAKAILDSNLSSVIENLPEGLDTHIGPRKDALSGGQLQRIGLARALYSQPKLLVLDEATSALDANSENEITSALDGMRGRVTVLIIAHRLNTIQRSDVVHLLDQGKIADSGTFSNLLKKNSTVRELAKLMAIETT